jgi:hypothetical protein
MRRTYFKIKLKYSYRTENTRSMTPTRGLEMWPGLLLLVLSVLLVPATAIGFPRQVQNFSNTRTQKWPGCLLLALSVLLVPATAIGFQCQIQNFSHNRTQKWPGLLLLALSVLLVPATAIGFPRQVQSFSHTRTRDVARSSAAGPLSAPGPSHSHRLPAPGTEFQLQ